MTVVTAAFSDRPLDVAGHLAAVTHPGAGAVASFTGMVRNHDREATGVVELLEYSAHPSAPDTIAKIAAHIDARYAEQGLRIAVTHRIGSLRVGDVAIVCCVSSAHRDAAFHACRELVEQVKKELPVWKKQHTESGDTGWVGIS